MAVAGDDDIADRLLLGPLSETAAGLWPLGDPKTGDTADEELGDIIELLLLFREPEAAEGEQAVTVIEEDIL